MNNEQSLLLAIRHQMSVLGYSESDINAQDQAIEHFTKLLIQSVEKEWKTELRRLNRIQPDITIICISMIQILVHGNMML